MLNEFVFENHLGQRFEGLPNGVFLNQSDLADYSWEYETINGKISRFYCGVRGRKIPLCVRCNSGDEADEVRNRLHELAESDIEAKEPGKIFAGDYYTLGFITGSTKSNYQKRKKYCNIELTLTSDDPAWYRERLFTFNPNANINNIGIGFDYPHDYPYDFAPTAKGRVITADTIRASEFRLRIYGECTDPTVIIGGHAYKLIGSIGAGENVLINSVTKTITLNTATGKRVNWFDKRSRDSYIFKPIPKGRRAVSWDGTFGFDLTIIEKRSEPKWT